MKRAIPTVRNPFDYDTNQVSDDTGCECKEPTKAQQHFREEVDINTIVERFNLTGQLPQNVRMPTSGDFTNVPTFQQAMDALVRAREAFDQMPAKVRARFHNNPAEFVEFCDNQDNLDEARKLGLVPPKEAQGDTAPPAPPAATAPPAPADNPKIP